MKRMHLCDNGMIYICIHGCVYIRYLWERLAHLLPCTSCPKVFFSFAFFLLPRLFEIPV